MNRKRFADVFRTLCVRTQTTTMLLLLLLMMMIMNMMLVPRGHVSWTIDGLIAFPSSLYRTPCVFVCLFFISPRRRLARQRRLLGPYSVRCLGFRSFPVRWSSISPPRLHPFSSYPRRLNYISDFPRARLYNNTPFSDFPTVQRCSPTTMKPTRSGWTAADCEVHRFVMAVMSRTTCVNGSQLYKWIYVCWIKRKFTYIYIYNTFCFPPS